ncbi:hypothetical protein [Pseudohaliea rubra]|uniref:SAM-dependent methyltransferase n=1 Tax=Pseudohaliea rubra DSM 19751 TaxID=1265313 RepID=A0A095XYA2_9GAMM|nr:hypothetical protein [Pseudohaliea rubra]KGE04731.1 SAM-dependent methyltransferase [Pseudohaliea rubra DSM 19751]
MRAVIHIGTEKTGSSSLQAYLCSGAGELAVAGVHCCTSAGDGNNRALVTAFMDLEESDDYTRLHGLDDTETRAAWRAAYLEAFEAEVAACTADLFVISSEHFHSRLLAPAQVAALAAFLRPLFDDIQVRVYLRRQDELALSFYSQKLRAGFIPPTILPLANVRRSPRTPPPYFDFQALLERWADAFGEAAVYPCLYDRSLLQGGEVVSDFCHFAALPLLDVVLPSPVNTALSAPAQAALLRFNECCGGDRESRERHRPTRNALAAYLQAHGAGRSVLPARAEAEEFYAAFAAGNAAVARRWFGREQLFNEDFSRYPEAPAPVDWERAAALLAGFAAGQSSPAC